MTARRCSFLAFLWAMAVSGGMVANPIACVAGVVCLMLRIVVCTCIDELRIRIFVDYRRFESWYQGTSVGAKPSGSVPAEDP